MALLASPHGLGDDGHAVHASGATRAQRHPSITELLRHPDLARNHLTGPAHEPGSGVETDAPSTPTATSTDRSGKPGLVAQVVDMTDLQHDKAELVIISLRITIARLSGLLAWPPTSVTSDPIQ